MRVLIIGGLAFFTFILFARWHYVCQIKGMCGDANVTKVEVPIPAEPAEEGTIGLEEDEKFEYAEQEAIPNLNSENEELTTKEIETTPNSFSNMSFSDISFSTASAVFRNPPRQFRLYADSLKTYLIENPEKRITVTGHTDNEGDEELNYKVGIRRGNSVAYYLSRQIGIKSTITVASKGETEPIESNDTPEGRRKNRRVQITIR